MILTVHHHLPKDNAPWNGVATLPSLPREVLSVWHQHFGQDRPLRLLTLESEAEASATLRTGPVGLAPLCLVRGPAGLRKLTFAGTFDYLDFAFSPDLGLTAGLATLLDHLFAQTDWHLLVLRNIPSTSPTLPALQSILEEREHPFRVWQTNIAPFLRLEGTWDDYYARRGRKARKNLRRAERKLAEMGAVRVRHCRTPEEVEAHLPKAFQIHARRWAREHTGSRFSTPQGRAYYRDLALAFARQGWLDLALLEVGHRPVAFAYSVVYGGRYHYWVAGHDPDPLYARWSPGKILIRHLLEDAFHQGLAEFDFGLGDEAYKWEWADDARAVYTVVVPNDTRAGRLAFQGYTRYMDLRERARSSERLMRWRRRGLGWLEQVRRET